MIQSDKRNAAAIRQPTARCKNSSDCQLLVSIRNAAEAHLALEAGVAWIDLKDPSQGPLGSPDAGTAQQVAQVLIDHRQSSAALGELHDLDFESAATLAKSFQILKIGLSNPKENAAFTLHWARQMRSLQARLQTFNANLVPVIYADWKLCNAISPDETISEAIMLGSTYVLVDTYHKDGTCLLDHASLDQLETWLERLAAVGCRLVVAGSLRMQDVPILRRLNLAALGIRGAVCDGPRDGQLSSKKLRQWQALF